MSFGPSLSAKSLLNSSHSISTLVFLLPFAKLSFFLSSLSSYLSSKPLSSVWEATSLVGALTLKTTSALCNKVKPSIVLGWGDTRDGDFGEIGDEDLELEWLLDDLRDVQDDGSVCVGLETLRSDLDSTLDILGILELLMVVEDNAVGESNEFGGDSDGLKIDSLKLEIVVNKRNWNAKTACYYMELNSNVIISIVFVQKINPAVSRKEIRPNGSLVVRLSDYLPI